MRLNTWTKDEIIFLKINYPKFGADYCVKKLGYNKSKIQNKAYKLNIKLTPKTKSNILSKPLNECNVNPELFYNIKTKEISYLLGLIWADGFLNPSKNGNNHNLGFTMVKEDFEVIRTTIESIGKWYLYERKQTVETWKPTFNIITNNKRIFNFLVDNDYRSKSTKSADKILSLIPNNLKHYFFRGLIDGDGCFYYYKPKKGSTLKQFSITSTYTQDWSYMIKLCKSLDIKFNIRLTSNISSSSSKFSITNKNGIIKLGEYIYKGDMFGLKRKYDKYLTIRNN